MRLVSEHCDEYRSGTAAYAANSSNLGCSLNSVCYWDRQALLDRVERPALIRAEMVRINKLERENRELPLAKETLKKPPACFAKAVLYRLFRK